MQRAIGRLRARASGFNPASVFAGSAAGLWLDPSDITTGFTDTAGTTPQTASGQQTGLRLDKRLGGPGAELLQDSGFDDTSKWSKASGVSVGSGVCTFASVANLSGIGQTAAVSLVTGKTYKATYTITSFTAGGARVYIGGTFGTTRTSVGTFTEYIVAGANTVVEIDANGTTTLVIDNFSVKLVDGNHVLQATANSRPEYDVISNISSDFLDGLDDGYSTAAFVAGTLTSGMDLFCAIKRGSTSNMVLASNGVANASFIGKMISADGTSSMAGVGTAWTVFVDGVQVGGTNSVTCGQLNTALGSGSYHVLEVRDLDLSAWVQFTLGLYTSFMLNADNGGVILPPAQSAANRAALRKWLGAKVGLSL